MNNDPERDPGLFAGKRRLYYGRWDYKYEMAAARGAAAAIVIHTTPSAGYSWSVVQNSWSGEQLSLAAATGPELSVKAWATEEACRRIARLSGQDLDALRARAESRDFRPVPLGVSASLRLENEVTRRTSANVIGRLAGSDPQLAKEAVLFTAHHDHYGSRPGPNGDDRDLQRRPRQRRRRRLAARRGRGLRRAARAPAPLDPVRRRSRPRSRDSWDRCTCRATCRSRRASSRPTSTSTAPASGAARATCR